MSLWILDTDTLSLFLHGESNVCQRVSRVPSVVQPDTDEAAGLRPSAPVVKS
ncbi:MAG: hypothetical protein IAG10_24045 [Planctomycetaceae bacterium]|nr:hypothetical protein [Planctomycetaceae bacterium]